ncbi:unnamed protein product, partial [Effrenium voratum]
MARHWVFAWTLAAQLQLRWAFLADPAERAAGALWGLFVGDALAMPVHWYYGGSQQIRQDFGGLLSGYERSVHPFPDSIMQLSNTGGGGRGGDEGDVV